jgi:hypothetical protein
MVTRLRQLVGFRNQAVGNMLAEREIGGRFLVTLCDVEPYAKPKRDSKQMSGRRLGLAMH